MTVIEWVQLSILLLAIALSITLSIVVLIKATREGFTIRQTAFLVLALGLLFVVYLAYTAREIHPADGAQIMLVTGLVAVTGVYALFTARQANASVKMAKEMKEQRVTASRPVIIQKAVVETETELATFGSRDWFSYFEVYNAGNGPAIELEISLLNKEKTPIHSQRKTFLRADEPPIEFSPSELASLEKSTFYLVCEYQSILSQGTRKTWYQTWLPFETVEASKEGKIYVNSGELEFKEVSEKERIDAFSRRSKPR